jgi:hypothetical protein
LTTERQSHSYVPIADWLFSYQKDWLRPDLIAGLTAAAVVIPKAMAYATIAGLPGTGRAVHCFSAHGDLRRDGHLSPTERKHHHYHRSFNRSRTR